MKVHIEDDYDGFSITLVALTDADIRALQGNQKRWRFDDSDPREKLVQVFRSLGIQCTYEEVY